MKCSTFASFSNILIIKFTIVMLVLKNKQEVTDFIQSLKYKGLTIGFVPTMGALHSGHLSLIKKSIEDNQYTICSIFVNPTQFNNLMDLEKYPRTEDSDIEKLNAVGCDAVYLPKIEDIYPKGTEIDPIDLKGLNSVMEGASRPGHFEGVATVVKRLFLQTQPTNAYFGEKDFQQLQVIKQMVKYLNLPINIIGIPIKREENGLAMSSRNIRLSQDYINKSTILYKSLIQAKELVKYHNPKEIIQIIKKIFNNSDLKLEYFNIADEESLLTPEEFLQGTHYRAFIAVYAGDVRLIDNLRIL